MDHTTKQLLAHVLQMEVARVLREQGISPPPLDPALWLDTADHFINHLSGVGYDITKRRPSGDWYREDPDDPEFITEYGWSRENPDDPEFTTEYGR
jgi:hypothetical protein